MTAITLIAAVLRLYRLGTESIWFDEASTWAVVREPLARFFRALIGLEVTPPLYFALMSGWTRLVGDNEIALRFPSFLAGTCAVPALGWLSKRLVGPGPALAGSLLLALSPFHIWYSQEARPYALFGLLVLLSTGTLVAAWQDNRRRAWLAYSFFALAACFTHYFSGYFLAGQATFVIMASHSMARSSPAYDQVLLRRRSWFASTTGVAILFLPWLPFVFRHRWSNIGWITGSLASTPPLLQLWQTGRIVLLGTAYPIALRDGIYLGTLLLLGIGVWMALRKTTQGLDRPPTGVVLLAVVSVLPVFMAWIVSQFRPSLVPRYLIPILPPAMVLIALGVWQFRSRAVRALVLSAIVLGQLWSLQNQIVAPVRPDWRGLAAYLRRCMQKGDGILVEESSFILALRYYMRNDLPPNVNLYAVRNLADPGLEFTRQLMTLDRLWYVDVRISPGRETIQPFLDASYPGTKIAREFWRMRSVKVYSLASPVPPDTKTCP